MYIELLSTLGFLISLYTYNTELNLKKNKRYKPICDVNNKLSCSKTLTSKFGHLAGFSNSLGGIFFYILILILANYNLNNYVFYLSIPGFIGTIYLAYLSLIRLKTYCLICNFIYVINILLLINSYLSL